MHSASIQETVRNSIISKAKENGIKDVTIPQFSFPALLKETDQFDLYHSIKFATYEGMSAIRMKNVGFDYSSVFFSKGMNKSGCINNFCVVNIYNGNMGLGLNPFLVIEVNSKNNFKNGVYFANIYDESNNKLNATLENPSEIDGRYFYPVRIKGIVHKKIRTINIGAYDRKQEKIVQQVALHLD
ncbi:hypothetical protein ECV0102_30960 [Enterobacter cloacae]|nr:hypothetical protein ECV0102_30960 [Enterobacter cloacae]